MTTISVLNKTGTTNLLERLEVRMFEIEKLLTSY
jgi:hypothetical protein